MYSPVDIKALRLELNQAMKSDDIVAALEAPVTSIEAQTSLIHCVAQEGILPERFLSTMLSILFRRKDREHFDRITHDESLGFDTLRSFWNISSLIRDNNPILTLDYIIQEYQRSDPSSITRVKWFSLIFGQSYRERNWDFVLAWIRVAIDKELSLVGKRYYYGVVIGLINDGYKEEAQALLDRRTPYMSDLDKLFFIIPFHKLQPALFTLPSTENLIHSLHNSLSTKGKEWDWFCSSYLKKISACKINLMNVRVDDSEIEQLREIILLALQNKTPLSFHRMGDGAVYRWPLPSIAASHDYTLIEDDRARELAWWNHRVDKEWGDKLAERVTEALRDADILGVVSVYRLIRDASEQSMLDNITGRSLLKHVEALGNTIPLADKVLTEDRAHTIIYTRGFIDTLFQQADSILIVGGLSAEQMNLPYHDNIKFIALIPEQNKGLPIAEGARSIIDDFDAISDDITEYCCPGTLALISGGYAGKALVAIAKQAGAVALDIGSLADLLAGYHTRSPADAI